jgi:hypothetical protein
LSPVAHSRVLFLLALTSAASFLSGCNASRGPSYLVEKQEIRVQFTPDPQPVIHLEAEYRLRNDGSRPLTLIEIRLPGRHSFHVAEPRAHWDSQTVAFEPSPFNSRNVQLTFPQSWTVSASHTLRLSADFLPPSQSEKALSFAPDAFFLPAEGWSPQLLPARGIFASGGVPPKKWQLTLRAPDGFLVHMSGRPSKPSRSNHEQTFRAEQRLESGYPFIIAGRYTSLQLKAGQESVNLWTRAQQNPADLRPAADALMQTLQIYNTMFGDRSAAVRQLWIVECPVADGCFTGAASSYVQLISERGAKPSSEMASLDSVMADLSSGAPKIAVLVGPALASSWLGYGQNPGFFEQDPPLSALPAFAAARGQEAAQGPQVVGGTSRTETIRRILRLIPAHADPRTPEDASVVRAKSVLFFYGLQDRYGEDAFDKALTRMLDARRGGGFNLDDLIAAFEQQVHENVAEFVRHWMKRHGVPEDFRARYESTTASAPTQEKAVILRLPVYPERLLRRAQGDRRTSTSTRATISASDPISAIPTNPKENP